MYKKFLSTANEKYRQNNKLLVMTSHEEVYSSLFMETIASIYNNHCTLGKMLVLASKSTITNELIPTCRDNGYFNLSIISAVGKTSDKKMSIKKDADIVFTNDEDLRWLDDEDLKGFKYLAIYDGSSVSNNKSRRFCKLKKIRKQMSGIIVFMPLPSDRKFDRIWAVAYIIDKGERLGVKKSAFIDRYFHHGCIWTEKTIKQYKELKEGGRAAVCKALFDISLKSPVQNSGDRIVFIDKYINLSASEYSKYCLLENELKISVGEKEINAKTASVLAGKLIQLSGGSIYDKDNVPVFFHNKKYDAIKRIVEKNQGKNILIACWFMHEKTRLMEVFPEARTIEDKKSVDSWNNGNIKIGIMNPATGGDGLDMSAGGNIIIWFSLTWSYKLYTRMNQRLYHTKKDTAEKTFVYHLIAKRTLDEKVLKILRKESGKNMTILKAITE